MQIAMAALTAVSSVVSSVAAGAGSVASSIGSALGLSSAAAATTAAGSAAAVPAAASGLSSLFSASNIFGILQGVTSIGSMFAERRAADQKAQSLNMEANSALADIPNEQIAGTERRNNLRRALLDTIGERDAATSASGLDISFGTPTIARQQATDDAERALAIDQGTEDQRVSRLRERSANLRIMAAQAKSAGKQNALLTGAKTALSLIGRG
jgi:hypothetical protein